MVDSVTSLAKTPIIIDKLEQELQSYPPHKADVILNGFNIGFPLHFTGLKRFTLSKNLKSANTHPNVVQEKIDKELLEGRVAGPFDYPPFPKLRVSPLGLVEKHNSSDFRLIHHLSYPEGSSVNDFIDPKLCTVQYTNFDQAVELVQQLGKGCLLGKSDIKSAFRLLPVAPKDFDQLGFCFQGKFYFDKCLPFGCSISPATFEKFSTFLEFAVRKRSEVGGILHYLDDFFFGGAKGSNHCSEIMFHFTECMSDLGVPIAEEKTEGPKTIIVFLGLEINSESLTIRIPDQKVTEIIKKISDIMQKSKSTLHEVQSLIGSLQFACRAIVPGRPFIRRLINAIRGLTRPRHYLRINKSIRNDLLMWLQFFQKFNRISVFHDRFWLTNTEAELFSDSAASVGFGVYFRGSWTHARWPNEWHESGLTANICLLEFFPLLVAIHIWGQELRNKKIIFYSDNVAVVQAVNSMTSKSEDMMVLLRSFTLQCLHFNLLAKAAHIPGSNNCITDSLSRFQMERFRKLAPQAKGEPEPVPQHLWQIFSTQQTSYYKLA